MDSGGPLLCSQDPAGPGPYVTFRDKVNYISKNNTVNILAPANFIPNCPET
jgi:hypothetical protein